jgi:hypothetical protein
MSKKQKIFAMFAATVLLTFTVPSAAKKKDKTPGDKAEITASGNPLLWREPDDLASRNLIDGPGGKEHEPHPPFTFVAEDMNGSNPKFDVRDQGGVKWKVKLGAEAKPETVAVRLVWAAGFFADEDYFLPTLRVNGMPAHLKRKGADKFIEADGSMLDVRLKRHREGEKKMGIWKWRYNPFTGTRELNGLRVMMALINNWDLKDENNAVYREKHSGNGPGLELIYMVNDLGASFGTTHLVRGHEKAKGNLESYRDSKFIRKVDGDFVDFDDPHRPAVVVLVNPHEFVSRLNLEWIGKHIPRADTKWMGQLLARLSPSQIRDAFRAAGYTPEEVEGFASVLESRIAELNRL